MAIHNITILSHQHNTKCSKHEYTNWINIFMNSYSIWSHTIWNSYWSSIIGCLHTSARSLCTRFHCVRCLCTSARHLYRCLHTATPFFICLLRVTQLWGVTWIARVATKAKHWLSSVTVCPNQKCWCIARITKLNNATIKITTINLRCCTRSVTTCDIFCSTVSVEESRSTVAQKTC